MAVDAVQVVAVHGRLVRGDAGERGGRGADAVGGEVVRVAVDATSRRARRRRRPPRRRSRRPAGPARRRRCGAARAGARWPASRPCRSRGGPRRTSRWTSSLRQDRSLIQPARPDGRPARQRDPRPALLAGGRGDQDDAAAAVGEAAHGESGEDGLVVGVRVHEDDGGCRGAGGHGRGTVLASEAVRRDAAGLSTQRQRQQSAGRTTARLGVTRAAVVVAFCTRVVKHNGGVGARGVLRPPRS